MKKYVVISVRLPPFWSVIQSDQKRMRIPNSETIKRCNLYGGKVVGRERKDKHWDKGIGFYAYKDDCWVFLDAIKKVLDISCRTG